MTELTNNLSKGNIRSQLNLIFAMMRLMSSVLDVAPDNVMVRDTLESMSGHVWEAAAVLKLDIGDYLNALGERTET